LAIDPESDDASPPGQIASIEVSSVNRGNVVGGGGDCADIGSLTLAVEPGEDDRTPSGSLGYVVRAVEADAPQELGTGDTPILADDGRLVLFWVDGTALVQEPLDFTLAVAPVDEAGNEGPATEVFLGDAEGSGCAVAHGADVGCGAAWLGVLAGILLTRRAGSPRPRSPRPASGGAAATAAS
jgi:hypothetical protein